MSEAGRPAALGAPRRVLSVIHYPTYGGPHNRNAHVIPVLRELGYETTVVLPSEPGNAGALLQERDVSVVQLPLGRLRAVRDAQTHVRMARQFRHDVGRLRGLIRASRSDLVLINGLANPHAALAARLEGVPVVWQLLDTFSPMKLRRAMMPVVTATADAVMSTGRAVAEQHPGATSFGERLVLFFPVVDPTHFVGDGPARRSARQRLGLPDDCIVVGTVGNLNPMKGHDVFVEAAAALKRRRPNTRFVILGAEYPQHERYASALRRSAQERGLELGRDLVIVDPGTDVAGLAPAFDIFWLTSNPRSEGIPTVIGEAMALGLPVVASRVGSVQEAVLDGVTGRLVPPRDPETLLDATLPYLDDERLRQVAGSAARSRAEQLYSPQACAERHVRAFELAIAHRRPGPEEVPSGSPQGVQPANGHAGNGNGRSVMGAPARTAGSHRPLSSRGGKGE